MCWWGWQERRVLNGRCINYEARAEMMSRSATGEERRRILCTSVSCGWDGGKEYHAATGKRCDADGV